MFLTLSRMGFDLVVAARDSYSVPFELISAVEVVVGWVGRVEF